MAALVASHNGTYDGLNLDWKTLKFNVAFRVTIGWSMPLLRNFVARYRNNPPRFRWCRWSWKSTRQKNGWNESRSSSKKLGPSSCSCRRRATPTGYWQKDSWVRFSQPAIVPSRKKAFVCALYSSKGRPWTVKTHFSFSLNGSDVNF